MGLHRRKHRERLRLPDYIAIILVTAVVVAAAIWWNEQFDDVWLQTGGRVIEGRVVDSHYNAPIVEKRVDLEYTYSANGELYTARWSGFWPVENSPNALPENRYDELFVEGYPLTVFYDARNPERSNPHRVPNEFHLVLTVITVALAALTCGYLFRVYPKWRAG